MKAPTKESKDGGREEKVAKENRKTTGGGERNQLEEETERGDGKKKFAKTPHGLKEKRKKNLTKTLVKQIK